MMWMAVAYVAGGIGVDRIAARYRRRCRQLEARTVGRDPEPDVWWMEPVATATIIATWPFLLALWGYDELKARR